MPHVITLQPDARTGVAAGLDAQLGPIGIVAPLEQGEESWGDTLEVVGSAVARGERRARPVALSIAVRGPDEATDPAAAGWRARRQLRQLLENAAWLAQPIPWTWRHDPEGDLWLMIGGGDLADSPRGVEQGEWKLALRDAYLLGRPTTHRAARRARIGDRRAGLVARDSWGTIYSTDYASLALQPAPLALPGDVVHVRGAGGRQPAAAATGPQQAGRRLWRSYVALDGEALAYQPDPIALPPAVGRHAQLDGPGSVRCWDLTEQADQVAAVLAQTRAAGVAPDPLPDYAWERVYGPLTRAADPPMAIDNGVCRCTWLGGSIAQGLLVERWTDTRWTPVCRWVAAGDMTETAVVELTMDRGLIEMVGEQTTMRVALQRGWPGPRLEARSASGPGRLELAAVPGPAPTTSVVATGTPGVRRVTVDGVQVHVAQSHEAVTAPAPAVAVDGIAAWQATGALALQVDVTGAGPAATAGLGLIDCIPVPTLVTR